jgi:hypothetical protein
MEKARTQMVADNFNDASELLEFAIERLLMFGAGAKDASGIRMLRNVKTSIFNANINSNIDALSTSSAQSRRLELSLRGSGHKLWPAGGSMRSAFAIAP